jgi:YihY family inner membrane protein
VGDFGDDDCGFLAGAIAYQLFFSLVPLLALVIGALGFIYGPERAMAEGAALIREAYPGARQEDTKIVEQLVEGRALSLSLGVIGTLLSATAIHGSMDSAVAGVLGREGRRELVRGKVDAVIFIAAIGCLALLSFAASYGVQAAGDLLSRWGLEGGVRVALEIGSPILGLLPGIGLFYVVYRLVPRKRVAHAHALRAAVVAGVLWEVAKLAFALLTRALATFQAYGALALAAGLLTWIYVSAAILLLGAELIKAQRRVPA